MKTVTLIALLLPLGGCADFADSMTTGWYRPGASAQDFATDKYECMSRSQMEVSGAYVNGYGGSASSGTTTNMPLFSACMQSRGYAWTNRLEVKRYEASHQ
jgi:hypothetical protein